MAESDTLAPLINALRDLMNWFETEHINGMVIGGVAASLLGRPRITRDVDILIQLEESRWSDFISQGASPFLSIPNRFCPYRIAFNMVDCLMN